MSDGFEFDHPSDLQVQAAVDNLDIVRDCADLAGTFPENVTLRFVYWKHGIITSVPTADELAGFVKPILPHLENAGVIAMENAGSHPDSLTALGADFKKIFGMAITSKNLTEQTQIVFNRLVHDKSEEPDKDFGIVLRFLNTLSAHQLAIANHFGASGQPMPEFVSVDRYDRTTDNDTPNTYIEDLMSGDVSHLVREVADYEDRESTVIRQLHSLATELARDGEAHTIAVLCGSLHTFTSVASKRLGALTERVVVDKPPRNLVQYLIRRSRMAGPTAPEEPAVFFTDEDISNIQTSIFVSGYRQLVKEFLEKDSASKQSPDADNGDPYWRAENDVILRYFAGRGLKPGQRQVVGEFLESQRRFEDQGYKMPKLFGKKALKNSLENYEALLREFQH